MIAVAFVVYAGKQLCAVADVLRLVYDAYEARKMTGCTVTVLLDVCREKGDGMNESHIPAPRDPRYVLA